MFHIEGDASDKFCPNINFVSPQTKQFQILKTYNVFKFFLYVQHSMSVL